MNPGETAHLMQHRRLTILSGGLLFLLLDFGAKSLDRWWRPPTPPQTHLSIRVAHPEYDHGIRPNAAGTESYGSQRAEYFSNSMGLRDAKIREVPLRADCRRILFMGDSMTEAGPVPWEKTFVGTLQVRWRDQTEVLNGAVADFGPVLILPKLEDLLGKKGLRVDQVVVMVNSSVLRTAFTYVPSPGGIQHRPYGPYQERAAFFAQTDKLEAWLEAHVEKKFVLLGALVRNARLSWRAMHPLTRSMDRLKFWVEQGFSDDPQEQRMVDEGIRRTLESLDRIHEYLASQKVALGVVFLPWPKTLLADSHPPLLPAKLDAWARAKGVSYLNLLPLFRREGSPEEVVARYYLKNDNHLTEAGHERVAAWSADPQNGLLTERVSATPR